MKQLDALILAAEAYGEAQAAADACPRYIGAAFEDPMRSAMEVRARASKELERAAITYFRAKTRAEKRRAKLSAATTPEQIEQSLTYDEGLIALGRMMKSGARLK